MNTPFQALGGMSGGAVFPLALFSLFCTMFICLRVIRWRGFSRRWLPVFTLCAALALALPLSGATRHPLPSEALAVAGYVWLTFAGFGLAIFILLDLTRALVWCCRLHFEGRGGDFLPPRRCVPLALLLALGLIAYAAFEARHPQVTCLGIQTDKLPPRMKQFRLVFVSDLHLGRLAGKGLVQKVTDLILEQNGDLLLFGGDIVDGGVSAHALEGHLLAAARPGVWGSLGVLGESEAGAGHEAAAFLERAWIRVLRGEALAVGGISIAGIDDPGLTEAQGGVPREILPLLERLPRDRFTVLLKHYPTIQPESVGHFDLQLSGHGLGGQIWPLKYLSAHILGAPRQGELTRLHGPQGSSWFYASRGAGFRLLPLRFWAPPEIVVIDLLR
jgi:predicted MPP superfamily phosphohydrolase